MTDFSEVEFLRQVGVLNKKSDCTPPPPAYSQGGQDAHFRTDFRYVLKIWEGRGGWSWGEMTAI